MAGPRAKNEKQKTKADCMNNITNNTTVAGDGEINVQSIFVFLIFTVFLSTSIVGVLCIKTVEDTPGHVKIEFELPPIKEEDDSVHCDKEENEESM